MRAAQNIIIWTIRPYVVRELPGWGVLYALVADYSKDWLWAGGPVKIIRGKRHGYLLQLDLSVWVDRLTYFLGRWYDLSTQTFISDVVRAGDTVIDVGANRGNFALAASRLVGEGGKVVCFEPNPNAFDILDRAIAANKIANISVHRIGLGDRDEQLTLSVPVFNSGEGTFGPPSYGEDVTYQISAEVRTGDRAIGEVQPSLIKIDVEGHECKVIAGLSETISRHCPIILVEVVPTSVRTLSALMAEFKYQGFKIGLKKERWHYKWELIPFGPEDRTFDSVWIHSDRMRDYATILNEHISLP